MGEKGRERERERDEEIGSKTLKEIETNKNEMKRDRRRAERDTAK